MSCHVTFYSHNFVPRLRPPSIRVAVESGDETVLSTDHSHMLWNGLQLVMYIHVHAVAHCCFYIILYMYICIYMSFVVVIVCACVLFL